LEQVGDRALDDPALTAVVMTASVMISYTRTRAENIIPTCKVGFLERPERIVLLIIGALFDRMAPVLWVIAVLGKLAVIHRMVFTYQESKRLEDAQLRTRSVAASRSANAVTVICFSSWVSSRTTQRLAGARAQLYKPFRVSSTKCGAPPLLGMRINRFGAGLLAFLGLSW
jgi:hypothetical protein